MTTRDGDSVFAAINSWLTPPFLFLYLNLTIGTIALISTFAAHKNQPPHPRQTVPPPPTPLERAASLLERVRSFDFSSYDSSQILQPEIHRDPPQLETPPKALVGNKSESEESDSESKLDSESEDRLTNSGKLVRAPSLIERLKSFGFTLDKFQHAQEETAAKTLHEEVVMVVDSTEIEPGKKLEAKKMKKSRSSKGSFSRNLEEEEEIDGRRPATVREKGRKAAAIIGTASAMDEEEDEEVDAKADEFINRFNHQLKLQRLDSLMRYRQNKSA